MDSEWPHDQMNFAQLPAGLMNIEPLKQYLKALESAVVSSAYTDRRMALLSLGRAVDSYFVTLDRAVPSVERAALYSYGWIKALLTLHDGSWEGPIAPLFSATNKDEEHAHRSILQLGLIAIAESILEQHRVGLLELVHSDSRGARFRYAVDVVGVEAEEANDYEWLSRNIRIRQEPILNLYLEAQPDIDRLMRKLVRRSYQDYIGYDADPIVDSHYLSLGAWVADRHFGQDSFDGDHRFGSLPFSFYRTTTAVVAGFALKHMRFCELLLKRHSQLRLSNVITITGEAPRMAEELAGAMECTQSEATQALDMLTLTPEDTRTLLPNLLPDPAPPPYVQLGSRSVLKSMDGQLNQPFLFMLRKLRHRHSRDWDRAVESREAQFRTDLYGLFESSRFRRWERPIKIYYNDKTRTDIDAAIFDRQTGCLGLIQLKWQDPFGASLRERESRRRNFESGATRWISSVTDWLKAHSLPEVERLVGLPEPAGGRIHQVRLFVLGRHFSAFSGDGRAIGGAAFGNYAQLLRLAASDTQAFSTHGLLWLYEELTTKSPLRLSGRVIEERHIQMGDMAITIERHPA